MTAIRSVYRRSPGSSTDSNQSLLQHSYFIAAAVIVFALVILRILVLRRRKQTLSDFFRIRGNPQYAYGSHPADDSHYGSMYHGIQLAPLPATYHPERRVRAADTDAHGRRINPAENWEGKDALPAYDNFDRPPKYVEAGWTHGGTPFPTSQFMVTPPTEGEQSGRGQPNTADEAPMENVNQPSNDTHTAAGAEAVPPTHHDLPSS